jgi:DNA-binding MarR family transcriptional regulator
MHKLSMIMSAFEVRFNDAADTELVRAHEDKGYKARKIPNLNTDHIRVLTQIATVSDLDEIEVRYLTQMLDFKQTTMHRAIKALETLDLVKSEASARDHRSFIVRLTEQGEEFVRMIDMLLEQPVDDESSKAASFIADKQQTHDDLKEIIAKEINMKAAAGSFAATGNVGNVTVNVQNIKTGEPEIGAADFKEKMRKRRSLRGKETIRMPLPVPAVHTELKEHLERRFGAAFQVGRNYIKSHALNTDPEDYEKRILRTISMPVVFKRLGVTNVSAVLDTLSGMSDEAVLTTLRPNIKYRDISDNPVKEIQMMVDKYSAAAIEENPSLRRRFSQLSAQVARQTRTKEQYSFGRKSLMNRKPGTDRDD